MVADVLLQPFGDDQDVIRGREDRLLRRSGDAGQAQAPLLLLLLDERRIDFQDQRDLQMAGKLPARRAEE